MDKPWMNPFICNHVQQKRSGANLVAIRDKRMNIRQMIGNRLYHVFKLPNNILTSGSKAQFRDR